MEESVNIKGILTTLFKHKQKTVVTLVLGAILLGGYTVFFPAPPPSYVARSIIMVKQGREFVPVSEIGDQRLPAPNYDAIINTEIQILTSKDLAGEVVHQIGPENIYPSTSEQLFSKELLNEAAVLKFSEDTAATRVAGTETIEITFRHEHPYMALKALSLLIEMFKDKHLEVFSDSKSSFLEEQTKTHRQKLNELEDRLSRFQQSRKMLSVEEQTNQLTKRREDLEGAIRTEQIKIDDLTQKMSFLREQREGIVQDSVSVALRTELNTLQRKEQELAERFVAGSVTMQNIHRDIAVVKDQLEKATEQVRKADLARGQVELARLRAELKPVETRIASLKAQLPEVEKGIRALVPNAREFADLKRETEIAQGNYLTYLRKAEESRISEDMDRRKITNVRVIEEPTMPMFPEKKPNRRIVLIGVLLVLGAGFGIAFAFEFLSHGMTTPADAEKKLQLPVMVAIAERHAT
jgi:polysaccharide biosynthesis protein PslE